jgi:hypothetical protein
MGQRSWPMLHWPCDLGLSNSEVVANACPTPTAWRRMAHHRCLRWYLSESQCAHRWCGKDRSHTLDVSHKIFTTSGRFVPKHRKSGWHTHMGNLTVFICCRLQLTVSPKHIKGLWLVMVGRWMLMVKKIIHRRPRPTRTNIVCLANINAALEDTRQDGGM